MQASRLLFIIFTVTTLLSNCMQQLQTEDNIFGDIKETITLKSPGNGELAKAGSSFKFSVPEEMAYGVVGLFLGTVSTDNNRILVEASKSNWTLGNRTGLLGYNPGTVPVNTIYRVNGDKTDLDITQGYQPDTGTYFWAVWGYDEFGNLSFASEARQVTLP